MSNSRAGYGPHSSAQPSHPPSRSQTHMRQMIPGRLNNMMANSSISTQVTHDPNFPIHTMQPSYYYMSPPILPQPQYTSSLPGTTNQGYPRQLLYVNNLYSNNILLPYIRNPSMNVPANANLATHGLPNNNEVPSYNNEAGQMHSQMTQLAGQSISATNFYPQPSLASQLPQREKKPALLQDPKTLEVLSLESKENSDPTASNNQAKASSKVEETTLVAQTSPSEQPGNIACEEFVNKISAAAMTSKDINSNEAAAVTSDLCKVEGNESTKEIESNAKSEISKKSAHLPKSDIFTLQSTIKDSNVPVQTQSSINSSDDFVSSKKNNLNQEMTSTESISSNKLKASASSTTDEAGRDEKKTDELKVSESRNREEKQNKDKDKKNEKVGELNKEKSDLNILNSESTISQNDTSLQYSDAKNNRLKQTKSENIEEDKTSSDSLTSNKAILKGAEVNVSKNSNPADLPLTLKDKSQDVSAKFVAINSESNEKLKNNSKINLNLESSEDKGNRDNSEIDKDGTNKQSNNNVSLEKSENQEKISSESVIFETKQDEENEDLSNEKSDDKEKTAPSKDLALPGIIPNNKGKLEYDAKYLKNLRTHSLCLKKPQLPPLDIVLKVPNTQNKTSLGSEHNFLPQFISSAYPRQMPPRLSGRGSQGRMPVRNAMKIIFSPSLTQDVKLHTVENAYKPPVYNVKHTVNQVPSELESVQTEDMLKRFRGILNKLTPQNYQKLLSQIDQLTINTVDRLTKVIELIFDKAIDEPAFCVQYAKLCSHVSRLQVKDDSEDKQKNEDLQFRNVLVLRCQNEFEGGMYRGIDIKERLKKIQETEDSEQQKILETELEEDKRKSRIRQLGIMKFIGELYTCGLIASVIMVQCLQTLCAKNDEESLECLCTLLRATGYKLDHCRKDLNSIFSHLQTTVDEKRTTARIRFKIQDILDMRRDGWKDRKIQDENKPRTIDQIHKEAREEEEIKQMEIQQHILKKQDSLSKKPALRQDEWIIASRRSNSGPTQQQMLESFKKLQDKTTNADNVQLGPSYTGMGWARGAHCGTQMQKPQASELFSRHSAHNDKDNRNLRQSSNSINRDKGRVNQTLGSQLHQMRNYNPSQDTDYSYSGRTSGGRMPSSSLFGSSEMKNEAGSRNNSMEKSSAQNSLNSSIKLDSPSKEAVKGTFKLKGKADLSEDELQQKTLDMLKDFIRIPDFQKAGCCIVELCNEQNVEAYVLTAINHALELSSQNDRILIGKLLCHLVMESIISDEQFYKGLHKLLEHVDDIAVDVPRIWDYMGEIFTHFFLQLKDNFRKTFFIKCLSPCVAVNKAAKLMVNIVKCASTLKSQNEVGQIWKSSGLMWSDFLPKDVDEKKFISDNEMLFTIEATKVSQKGHKGSVIDKEFSDKIDALSDFIMTLKDSPLETLISYINKNFSPDEFSKPQFVSALYKSIVKSCITIEKDSMSYSLNVDLLKEYFNKFGTKFTQGDDKCELQTLFALQTLMEELEHPKNLLLEIFHPLYECAVISKEAFFEWEKSGEELRGKGVSVMEVKQFLLWLSEGDEDSDS